MCSLFIIYFQSLLLTWLAMLDCLCITNLIHSLLYSDNRSRCLHARMSMSEESRRKDVPGMEPRRKDVSWKWTIMTSLNHFHVGLTVRYHIFGTVRYRNFGTASIRTHYGRSWVHFSGGRFCLSPIIIQGWHYKGHHQFVTRFKDFQCSRYRQFNQHWTANSCLKR